jgi:hypothetical protein
VPTPAKPAFARVWCHTIPIDASGTTHGDSAIPALPIRGTRANVRRCAVATVPTGLRARGRFALRVVPAVDAVAGVRGTTFTTIQATLLTQRVLASGTRIARPACASVIPDANAVAESMTMNNNHSTNDAEGRT